MCNSNHNLNLAAKKNGNAVIYSTFSSYSIEEICAAHREQTNEKGLNPPIWFQLYVVRDREVTAQLIKKAEKAGVKALVVTVDLPIFGPRYEYLRNPGEFTYANACRGCIEIINWNLLFSVLATFVSKLAVSKGLWKRLSTSQIPTWLSGALWSG